MASLVRCRAASARACWNISCTSVPRWSLVSARRFSISASASSSSPRLSRRSMWVVICEAEGVSRVSTPGLAASSSLARLSQPPSGGMGSRVVRLALGFSPPPPAMDWAKEAPTGALARARASRATRKRGLIVTWSSVKSRGGSSLTRATGPLAILDDHHFSPGWFWLDIGARGPGVLSTRSPEMGWGCKTQDRDPIRRHASKVFSFDGNFPQPPRKI